MTLAQISGSVKNLISGSNTSYHTIIIAIRHSKRPFIISKNLETALNALHTFCEIMERQEKPNIFHTSYLKASFLT